MVPFSAVRLLIDYRPALRERTGVGEFVHELAKALSGRARNGVIPPHDAKSASWGPRPLEVTLFTSSWKDRPAPALALEMPAARIADVKVPVRGLVWAWNRLEWPPVEWLAGDHDVVHSQSPLLIPASRAAQCVTVHDLDFLRHPEHMTAEIRRDYPALARAHAARADAVIVSSQYAAAEVSRELQLAASRVHVCPPGRPHWAAGVARRRQAAGHRGKHILFMGTLSLRKNVGTLLEAYSRLRAQVPDAPPLVLAGHRTAASTRWEARCEQPPLKGHVTITGYVTTQQRIDLYADAAMLVLPSYEEGFGLPVLEAMACGVPVIVSSRGSLPEVAGGAATPIDPDDAGGFTAEMRALLDPRAAAAAGERGFAQAARYSWDACADAALAAYASATEARARRH
jgi:glycosyltransferase involved in cell wall biosynthesis